MKVLSVDAPTLHRVGRAQSDHLGVAARRNRNRWNQTRDRHPVTLPVVVTVDRVLAAVEFGDIWMMRKMLLNQRERTTSLR